MERYTERLLLRDFTEEDGAGLYEILGDAQTMTWCEPPYTLEQTEQFLRCFCIGRRAAVAVVLRATGKLIGYLLWHEVERGIYEIGWFFHRSFWRKGYAYESCKALMEEGFTALGAHKIVAETADGVKSVALMKKLGMRLEGFAKQQAKLPDGTWADRYSYGVLASEWNRQEKRLLEAGGQLRSMVSLYLMRGEQVLLLWRVGSRVVQPSWCGIGGHMEMSELNDARAALLRETREEIGLSEDELCDLTMRYITLRYVKGEVRQNYYFFATLREGAQVATTCSEGQLRWFPLAETEHISMPHSARYVMQHYRQEGRHTNVLYGGMAGSQEGVCFEALREF